MDGLFTREGLKAEFACIAEVMLAVFQKGAAVKPHVPKMRVAVVFVIGINKMSAGAGGAGDVWDIRTKLFAKRRQHALKYFEVGFLLSVVNLRTEGEGFQFVIAAENGKACVVADSL